MSTLSLPLQVAKSRNVSKNGNIIVAEERESSNTLFVKKENETDGRIIDVTTYKKVLDKYVNGIQDLHEENLKKYRKSLPFMDESSFGKTMHELQLDSAISSESIFDELVSRPDSTFISQREYLDVADVKYVDYENQKNSYSKLVPICMEHGLKRIDLRPVNLEAEIPIIRSITEQDIEDMINKEKEEKVREQLRKYSKGRLEFSQNVEKDKSTELDREKLIEELKEEKEKLSSPSEDVQNIIM